MIIIQLLFVPADAVVDKPQSLAPAAQPHLGVVSFNGSKLNNIVWPPTQDGAGPAGHETGTVFIDTKPGIPASQKYKSECNGHLARSQCFSQLIICCYPTAPQWSAHGRPVLTHS
eukprot:SAG22_NODE_1169_length_5270_cov_15.228969_4_plen_115_part_00